MPNKLLTDEELREELAGYINAYGRYINDDGTPKELLDELVDLIKQQRLAHGEMVIGEDDVPRNTLEHSCRNFLRREQRERNTHAA